MTFQQSGKRRLGKTHTSRPTVTLQREINKTICE